jgi:hypothetical protein
MDWKFYENPMIYNTQEQIKNLLNEWIKILEKSLKNLRMKWPLSERTKSAKKSYDWNTTRVGGLKIVKNRTIVRPLAWGLENPSF